MSGGFFRGTSAEQDTRFSNKHAKLLKSQKFAPELDHLADMTKIKMDVMRPWIAKRATEFLGFEDEVLINFIYGLLEGKNVNGKEIQISLTGFMEKNTAKFMKELWSLLISAQNNASGVPQQFLEAKEEETRKKKVESDKIANEIQKKCEKENRDVDQVRPKKMAFDFDISRDAVAAALLHVSRPVISNTSPVSIDDARDTTQRNGSSRRKRRTSQSHSVSPEAHKHSISSGGCDSPRWRYSIPHRQSGREPGSPSRFNSRSPSVKCKQHYRSPPRRHRSPSLSPREISVSPILHGVYVHGHRGSPPSSSHRSRSLYGSSTSPIEQELTPRRTIDHKKSPLVQEISLCFNHDHVVEDGLVPIHRECKIGIPTPHTFLNSPQKDSKGIKYFYKKNTPSYISPDRSARMSEGTTIQRKLIRGGDTVNTLPIKSLERECSKKMVESSKHRKCEVEKCSQRSWESDSGGSVRLREAGRGGKMHNKKRDRKNRIDYSGSEDSEEEGKVAKRRRRVARKEDRRRRREERRHRKEEKRVEKKRSTCEKIGSEEVHRRDDCEERRLEVELRKKAIESLRAKKAIKS